MSAQRTPTTARIFLARVNLARCTVLLIAAVLFVGCADRAIPSVLQSTTQAYANGRVSSPVTVDATAGLDGTAIPAIGAVNPLVIVSLFTDYQCPNCRRAHDVAQRIVDRWPADVQVQFRHLPLNMHPLAIPAAIAAQAAHRQGRFMCMHTAIIKTRTVWTALDLFGFRAFVADVLVPRCKLDAAAFARDIDDPDLETAVIAERERARDIEILGTPSMLVNGLEADAWPRPGHPSMRLVSGLIRRELRDAQGPGQSHSACPIADSACRVAERILSNTGDSRRTALILGADR
jgi:protein-disulfide isomerase